MLDFAVNVRPGGPPVWLTDRLAARLPDLGSYPGQADQRRAVHAVARRHGRAADEVALLAGGAEGFALLAGLRPQLAALVAPSFTEREALLAAAGVTGGSFYFLTENMALEYAPASNVSLIVCTAPVWTAVLLSLLYRGERMTRRQAVGSALAFAGMVLVVLNGRFVLRLSPRGDMLALSAALLWMVYSLVIKRIGGRYPAVFITRKVFFYGLLTILPVFVFQPFSITSEVLARPAVWGNLLFLGIVASMLCYVLWNAAMHRLGAVRTTNYIYFNPLVTIITAAACIGERITPAALAGAALILYGMWRAERG